MKFFCVLCVLFGFASRALALEREAFMVAKYDLAIALEPQQQRLGARGKITLRNDSGHPQKIVALQISSSLSWRSIRVDGKAVQFVSQPYVSDIDHTGALSEAIVTLPVEIKPKGSVELEIGYEGVIPLDSTRLIRVGVPEGIAKHTSWDQLGRGILSEWRLFLYLTALMTMMIFLSHGTQDMYPTFLKLQRGFEPKEVAKIAVVYTSGALLGGICFGLWSDKFGRKRSMIAGSKSKPFLRVRLPTNRTRMRAGDGGRP